MLEFLCYGARERRGEISNLGDQYIFNVVWRDTSNKDLDIGNSSNVPSTRPMRRQQPSPKIRWGLTAIADHVGCPFPRVAVRGWRARIFLFREKKSWARAEHVLQSAKMTEIKGSSEWKVQYTSHGHATSLHAGLYLSYTMLSTYTCCSSTTQPRRHHWFSSARYWLKLEALEICRF